MSTTDHSPCSGLGLFQNFFHAPHLSNWASMTQQAPDQLMRGFARWQLEVQGLMVRRAQAYMELPGRLSQCRTPQDLMSEQQRFMQNCMAQYSQSTRQIMNAWAQMFQLPTAPASARQERDYLSFPEPRAANGAAPDSQYGRKVA